MFTYINDIVYCTVRASDLPRSRLFPMEERRVRSVSGRERLHENLLRTSGGGSRVRKEIPLLGDGK